MSGFVRESGQVIDEREDYVVVRMIRQEACAKCGACIKGLTEKEMIIEAKNECNAKADDWVLIELQNNYFLKAILIMYGVPFVFMMAGFVLGYYGSEYLMLENIKDILAFSLGILMAVLAYALIKSREEFFKKQEYSPLAVEIITK